MATFTRSQVILMVGAAVAAVFALVAINPGLRNLLRRNYKVPYRQILSTASGILEKGGPPIKVIKVKTHKGLFIEVYVSGPNQTKPLLDRFQLPDQRDGYFHFCGQATNLALEDIDGDTTLEILAPSFDEELVAHLNVYSYNSRTKKFEPARR